MMVYSQYTDQWQHSARNANREASHMLRSHIFHSFNYDVAL